MKDKQRIQAPEGVVSLMENLWLRHKVGLKQPENNAFWIDFPPLTYEEKAELEANKKAELEAYKAIDKLASEHGVEEQDDNPEDLYGAWI